MPPRALAIIATLIVGTAVCAVSWAYALAGIAWVVRQAGPELSLLFVLSVVVAVVVVDVARR